MFSIKITPLLGNVLILLLYSGGINLLSITSYTPEPGYNSLLPQIITQALLIGIHAGICLLLAIGFAISRKWKSAREYLLSGGVVLITGLSTCLGGVALQNAIFAK